MSSQETKTSSDAPKDKTNEKTANEKPAASTFKKKNPKGPSAPVNSATQRLFASEIKVTAAEQHTGYYLDIGSLLTISSNFAATVRELHRRGAHPQNLVYQGIFFKVLAAKLQAVGIETHQIRANEDQRIGIQGIHLPQCLTHAISQYGVAYDGIGTKIYPLVTDKLIIYFNHLANLMMTTPTQLLFQRENHYNFIEQAYGEIDQAFIGLFYLRERLGVPAIAFDSHDIAGLTDLGLSIYLKARIQDNNVPDDGEVEAHRDATMGNWFLSGSAVPAVDAIPIAKPEIVAAATEVRGHLVNFVNPFAAARLPNALTSVAAQLVAPGSVRAHIRHLATIYSCSAPVINSTGSLAPLIHVDVLSRRVTSSSFLFNCPVRDYVTAMTLLGTTSVIVKNIDGCIFNVSTSQAQELDYTTNKMKMSFIEALIAVFDECLK